VCGHRAVAVAIRRRRVPEDVPIRVERHLGAVRDPTLVSSFRQPPPGRGVPAPIVWMDTKLVARVDERSRS
jgi:hypothetical protein